MKCFAGDFNDEENTFILYNQDGESYTPIEGTKFVITDLEGKNVFDVNGQIVGELENINGKELYVLTTNNNGKVSVNLPKGNYKAIKVYENEAYILEENEEHRTYYFDIETYEEDKNEWINGIRGYSWNDIKSTIKTSNNQIVSVGSVSEYSKDVTGEFFDGVDLDNDENIDQKSNGQKDGIIVFYNDKGKYIKSAILGGEDDDSCNQIIQTNDGGYIIIGYVSSTKVTLNGKIIPKLSKNNYDVKGKDGFILKIKSDGEYEWAIRLGGNLNDEIIKITECENGDLGIVGNFCSRFGSTVISVFICMCFFLSCFVC